MTVEQMLARLVSFPVLGGESNLSIIHWIKEYIESFGIETTLVPNEENTKASLHCRIGPAVDGGFILSGHTDVVPVKGQDWSTDPFTLTEGEEGRLFARGSSDMKGFVACCLAVLSEMIQSDLSKPIYFAFSYDEEIGCVAAPDLITHLKQHYTEQPRFAIIGEPSMMQPIVGQKGICVLRTDVNGSAGHSSQIRQEVSAIHEATRLIIWLENKMNQLVEAGRIDERFDPPHSSIHVGKFVSGIAPNVISDKAVFYWDVRNIPKDSADDIIGEYESYCRSLEVKVRNKYPEFNISTTKAHPVVPPLDTKEEMEITSILKKITGNGEFGTVAYAAEAGQFAEAGFESIICGPGSIDRAHRADEFITKQELAEGVEMLRNLIKMVSL